MAEKVVLAYSGGLDTSVAIKWLAEKYNLEVPFRVLITNRFGCTDEKIPKFLDYELETNHKGIKSVS